MTPTEGLVFVALSSLVGMIVITGMLVTAAAFVALVKVVKKI